MNVGGNQRLANSVNTQYRDEAQINFNNKAVTKIKITNHGTPGAHPISSNTVPISTTNVKLIQNRFTQQVQNLSNNFCDSGLGTPSSLNDTKNPIESNRGDSGSTMISTTPNGQISSSMIESVSNNSSTQNTNSCTGPYEYAMKGYTNTSSSSTASKWKSSMSGKRSLFKTKINCIINCRILLKYPHILKSNIPIFAIPHTGCIIEQRGCIPS